MVAAVGVEQSAGVLVELSHGRRRQAVREAVVLGQELAVVQAQCRWCLPRQAAGECLPEPQAGVGELRLAAGGGAARAAHHLPGAAVEQFDLAGELTAALVIDRGTVALEGVGERAKRGEDRCAVWVGGEPSTEHHHPLTAARAGPALADGADRIGAAGHAERDRSAVRKASGVMVAGRSRIDQSGQIANGSVRSRSVRSAPLGCCAATVMLR